jgi:hypothetical protein
MYMWMGHKNGRDISKEEKISPSENLLNFLPHVWSHDFIFTKRT